MKQIILSEGKNDIFFLSEFLGQFDHKIDIFIKEDEQERSGKYGDQSNCIRSFIESRSPYDTLLKSEGGKINLLKVFCTLLIYLVRNVDEVIMVIDLDSNDDPGIKRLDDRICDIVKSKHSGGGFEIKYERLVTNCDNLVALRYQIFQWGRPMEENFIVIGFMPSLENIAGIQDNHNREEKIERIKHLLERDVGLFNFFQSILLTSN